MQPGGDPNERASGTPVGLQPGYTLQAVRTSAPARCPRPGPLLTAQHSEQGLARDTLPAAGRLKPAHLREPEGRGADRKGGAKTGSEALKSLAAAGA